MSETVNYAKKICRFKGNATNSCGFKRGKAYLLEIADIESKVGYYTEYIVKIKAQGHNCLYSDMDKFLENWEIIG